MSSPVPAVASLIRRLRAVTRGERRGSILILVIAVLVMLVIIGTAALSTNTIDRYATQQNNFNTEIDLLVEGVKKMAESVIVGDLYDSAVANPANRYRPGAGVAVTYDHWDMPLMFDPEAAPTAMDLAVVQQLAVSNDAWLASRIPSLLFPADITTGVTPIPPLPVDLATNPPVWDAISAPLEVANGIDGPNQSLFDTPLVGTGTYTKTVSGTVVPDSTATAAAGLPSSYPWRATLRYDATRNGQTFPAYSVRLQPGVIDTFTKAGVSYTYSPPLPAWTIPNPANPSQLLKVVAADADGDGVADSGLRALPFGEINGLKYYVGVRIVDNGSAINVNTAWSRDHEFLSDAGAGTFAVSSRNGTVVPQETNFFPSNIGLAEFLVGNDPAASNLSQMQGATVAASTELGKIDRYRFNAATTADASLYPTGVVSSQSGSGTVNGTPFVDYPPGSGTMTKTGRTDFAYNTIGELLYFGLTKRLNNPGVVAQSSPNTDVHFQRFSVGESAALAYRFTLMNPNASKSALESDLSSAPLSSLSVSLTVPNPTYPNATVQKSAYDPSDGLKWFKNNFYFDYDPTPNINPEYTAAYVEQPNNFHNRRSLLTADNPVSNAEPGTITTVAGTTTSNVKVSLNTGTQVDLEQAYLAVMTEGNQKTPYEITGSTTAAMNPPPTPDKMYAYAGMRYSAPPETDFRSAAPSGSDAESQKYTTFAPIIDTNPERMFRNALRDNSNLSSVTGNPTAIYDDINNTMPAVTSSANAVRFDPTEMRRLRSYIAAANTVSMRDSTHPRGPTTIPATDAPRHLTAKVGSVDTPVDLYIYPVAQQPYITEVYVNTDTLKTPNDYDTLSTITVKNNEPYVAVELFYPHYIANGAPISLANWRLAVINRDRTGNANQTLKSITVIHTFSAGDRFDVPDPAFDRRYGSYVILENFDPTATIGTNAVSYRPASSGLPAQADITRNDGSKPPVRGIYVKALADVVAGGYISGTDNLGGTITPTATGEGVELVLLAPPVVGAPSKPVDSYDFTGLQNDSTAATPLGHVWHYCRQGQPLIGGTASLPWSFIYPGRYDGAPKTRRQEGTQVGVWSLDTDPGQVGTPLPVRANGYRDPFDTTVSGYGVALVPPPTLGSGDNASDFASFSNTFTIQLLNLDQPGWNQLTSAVQNKFPFGGFARVSDVMQVPFFGSYVVLPAGTPIPVGVGAPPPPTLEMNSLSMDASYCEDTDNYDDANHRDLVRDAWVGQDFQHNGEYEQIGRFCPLRVDVGVGGGGGVLPPAAIYINDLDPLPEKTYRYFYPDPPYKANGTQTLGWRYHWATRVFDYLTVQDPQSDFLPNVLPADYSATTGKESVPVSNEGGRAGLGTGDTNTNATAGAENNVPLHGLININTASWRVLATINWTPFAPGNANRDLFTLTQDAALHGDWNFTVGGDGIDDNVEIAKAIAWWRDGVCATPVDIPPTPPGPQGPFKSVFDLNKILALQTYSQEIQSARTQADDADGDYSPYNPTLSAYPGYGSGVDGIIMDFEDSYEMLGRVSSLLTTRSDSYTVYIIVQGWRNAGSIDPSKPPQVVVQRRAAFIADRSRITATGGSLKVTPVATD